MHVRFAIPAIVACGFAASLAQAQRVPFFAPAGTGFDPEISVVNSGQLLDVQPVVSSDLKYVTINTRADSSRLLALREFKFADGGAGNNARLGFVGGAGGFLLRGRGDAPQNSLDRPGMTFLARLGD
jgi:hypothetical protein